MTPEEALDRFVALAVDRSCSAYSHNYEEEERALREVLLKGKTKKEKFRQAMGRAFNAVEDAMDLLNQKRDKEMKLWAELLDLKLRLSDAREKA